MKAFSFLLALLTITITAHADENVTENIKVVNASSNSVNSSPIQSMMDGARQLLAEENYRAAAVELNNWQNLTSLIPKYGASSVGQLI